MPTDRPANRLAGEQSPYLLQHAHNPVDWYPWGDEAFAKARAEDKPVFVSIGYAACHWCHVMERESFEDEDVAALLNERYVSVKVDREERPDVDAMCMDVCQSLTGHGGWPLTIVMDADRRPFFAGTYFPRHSVGNRLGFLDLMTRLHDVWTSDRNRVLETAGEITAALREQAAADFRADVPANVMDIIDDHHRRMFDDVHGGFSVRPKFPSPHHLLLLLRRHYATADPGLLSMVCATLDAMRAGGLYDHVGGGFHRYSTDREWLVPHFEKMLYDQAMLMMAYTEAWQITRDPLYASTVRDIGAYLRRDLTVADGRFASAQDADSEGVEGKFYIWTADELADVPDHLRELLNVRAEGNFHDEATGDPMPANILHVKPGQLRELERDPAWPAIREALRTRRADRVPPLTDDKVLTDWNGLMIGALARAGRALGDAELTMMAERAYGAFTVPVVHHRSRNGHDAVHAMLDDHAMMGWAALELYQTTANASYLRDALDEADLIIERFADDHGALYSVDRDAQDVPVRQKQGYDSAYPSGNSMAAMLFTGLAALTNERRFASAARTCVTTYGAHLARHAPGFCMLLCAWDTLQGGSRDIVLQGAFGSPFIDEAFRHIAASYQPRSVFVHRPADEFASSILREAAFPFDLAPDDAVLVCTDRACERPLTTIDDVRAAF